MKTMLKLTALSLAVSVVACASPADDPASSESADDALTRRSGCVADAPTPPPPPAPTPSTPPPPPLPATTQDPTSWDPDSCSGPKLTAQEMTARFAPGARFQHLADLHPKVWASACGIGGCTAWAPSSVALYHTAFNRRRLIPSTITLHGNPDRSGNIELNGTDAVPTSSDPRFYVADWYVRAARGDTTAYFNVDSPFASPATTSGIYNITASCARFQVDLVSTDGTQKFRVVLAGKMPAS